MRKFLKIKCSALKIQIVQLVDQSLRGNDQRTTLIARKIVGDDSELGIETSNLVDNPSSEIKTQIA